MRQLINMSMKTIKILFVFLGVVIPCGVLAQSDVFNTKSSVTNFFEYGKQVENADDNFLNLQQNFEKYCDNAEIIRFVSWKKTGTVRRAAQLKKLMKKNVAMTPPYTLAASVRREGENTQSSIRLERISPMPDRKMIESLLPQEIDASPYMNHDIYELSFTVNNEFFRQYYVVNRDTHHVVHFFTNIFDSDIKTFDNTAGASQ